jgi:predicted metal-dependent hydrolase
MSAGVTANCIVVPARPKCHTDQIERWLQARQMNMLSVPYFHVVVAAPKELRAVLRANQRDGYAMLMKVAAEAIVELSRDRRHVGGTVGILAVLHTWNQQLSLLSARALPWSPAAASPTTARRGIPRGSRSWSE